MINISKCSNSYLLTPLSPYHSKSGISLDVDPHKIIKRDGPYTYPWVGVFKTSKPFMDDEFFELPDIAESFEHCKCIITFSEFDRHYFKKRGIPSISVFYPANKSKDWNCFNYNKLNIVHTGSCKFPVPENMVIYNYKDYDFNVDPLAVIINSCEFISDMSQSNYVDLISICAADNIPIILDKYPVGAEYLGDDYPLFMNRIEDAYKKLTDYALLCEASKYLDRMDKYKFKTHTYAYTIMHKIRQILTGEENGIN